MNSDYFKRALGVISKLQPKLEEIKECEHKEYVVNPDQSKVCKTCFCVIGYYDNSHDNYKNKKYCYKRTSEFTKVFRTFTTLYTVDEEILQSIKLNLKKNYQLKDVKKLCAQYQVKNCDVIHYFNALKGYPINLKFTDLEKIKHYAIPFLNNVKCNILYRAVIYYISKDKLNIDAKYLISTCSLNVMKKWKNLYNEFFLKS